MLSRRIGLAILSRGLGGNLNERKPKISLTNKARNTVIAPGRSCLINAAFGIRAIAYAAQGPVGLRLRF
jgi:hypothetical protein